MATTVTLNVTGRDIVSALRAGKSVMVHSEVNGREEYVQPYSIFFSESEDKFSMSSVPIFDQTCSFISTLDGPLTSIVDSGGRK